MDLHRRYALLGAGWTSLMASGCVTTMLFEDIQYQETVSTVLISQDRSTIAVMGQQFHYVFDAPPPILRTFVSSLRTRIEGRFSRFQVDQDNRIVGWYALVTAPGLTPSEIETAQELGFKLESPGKWVAEGKLTGKRYQAGATVAPSLPQALNKTYTMVISARQPKKELGAKIALTPITVTADGVILLSSMILAPLLMPLASTVCPGCK